MPKPFQLPESPRILTFVSDDSVEAGLARLPYLRALRHAFPSGQLIWMVGKGPSAFRGDLLTVGKGLIDRVIDTVPIDGRVGELFGRKLASEQFDLVIDTQPSLLTALVVKRIRSVHFLSASGDFMLSDRRPAGRAPPPPPPRPPLPPRGPAPGPPPATAPPPPPP